MPQFNIVKWSTMTSRCPCWSVLVMNLSSHTLLNQCAFSILKLQAAQICRLLILRSMLSSGLHRLQIALPRIKMLYAQSNWQNIYQIKLPETVMVIENLNHRLVLNNFQRTSIDSFYNDDDDHHHYNNDSYVSSSSVHKS